MDGLLLLGQVMQDGHDKIKGAIDGGCGFGPSFYNPMQQLFAASHRPTGIGSKPAHDAMLFFATTCSGRRELAADGGPFVVSVLCGYGVRNNASSQSYGRMA